jgi:hypothetical protein
LHHPARQLIAATVCASQVTVASRRMPTAFASFSRQPRLLSLHAARVSSLALFLSSARRVMRGWRSRQAQHACSAAGADLILPHPVRACALARRGDSEDGDLVAHTQGCRRVCFPIRQAFVGLAGRQGGGRGQGAQHRAAPRECFVRTCTAPRECFVRTCTARPSMKSEECTLAVRPCTAPASCLLPSFPSATCTQRAEGELLHRAHTDTVSASCC